MGIFYNDPQPTQRAPRLPASALTTGSQPPRNAVAGAIAMATILAAWPAQGEPRPIQPMQGRSQIAPLTLQYGQQPPIAGSITPTEMSIVRSSWPDEGEPRLQQHNHYPERRRYIAPQTLVYGQQPPVAGAITPTELNIAVRSWDPPFLYPESEANSAGWNIPAPIASQVPYTRVTISWPPDGSLAQRTTQIAPLTLVYGQQPPIVAIRILAPPPQWWSAQSAPPSAAWNVPVVGVNQPAPYRVQNYTVRFAWEAPFQYPSSDGDSAGWNVPVVVASFVPIGRLQPQISPVSYWTQEPRRFVVPASTAAAFIPRSAYRAHLFAAWIASPQYSQLRRYLVQAGVASTETNALTGLISVAPTLAGSVLVAPTLDARILTAVELQGIVDTSPQLRGVILVSPVLLGRILVRPEQ